MSTRYRHCACRDCFETTIGGPGEMCSDCEDSGCDGHHECSQPDEQEHRDYINERFGARA